MSTALWIRSHVERLLQEEWDTCRVTVDDDGDYPFRCGIAAGWVQAMESDPVMVRVFAHAATGLGPSLKLFAELNSIQCRTLSATVHAALRRGRRLADHQPLRADRPGAGASTEGRRRARRRHRASTSGDVQRRNALPVAAAARWRRRLSIDATEAHRTSLTRAV